jgi:hypothetical protein
MPPMTPAQRAYHQKVRANNRRNMLQWLPRQGVGAEIGVWEGAFTAEILKYAGPKKLVLIDPWDLLAGSKPDDWVHDANSDAARMRAMHDKVQETYGMLPGVEIRRGFSTDVLESYPDDHFDWVYIDGNHLYDFVRADLRLALAKVKGGGIVAGDDFYWQKDGRSHVYEAVRDELTAHGLPFPPPRMGGQYIIPMVHKAPPKKARKG